VHALAVRAARTFELRNAATAEFLLDRDGRFWFLEVNTRLQVEHGVTELVSGIDLVQEQLWIASGRHLSERVLEAAEAAPDPALHAIEVRISAEDPGAGFLPATGAIAAWHEPGGPGVRIDAGVEAGSRVTADYDPLLAKLLVVAADRPSSLARLRRAVAEFEVAGLQTTLPFHRWISTDPEFAAGRVWTGFVEERWRPGPVREAAARHAADLAAAATLHVGGEVAGWGSRRGGGPGASSLDGAGGAIGGRQPVAAASAWSAAGRRAAVERWPR
jgi:acetyl/propionyl-CoA carboxylase alpha subunit